jgi:hypothetical protein
MCHAVQVGFQGLDNLLAGQIEFPRALRDGLQEWGKPSPPILGARGSWLGSSVPSAANDKERATGEHQQRRRWFRHGDGLAIDEIVHHGDVEFDAIVGAERGVAIGDADAVNNR